MKSCLVVEQTADGRVSSGAQRRNHLSNTHTQASADAGGLKHTHQERVYDWTCSLSPLADTNTPSSTVCAHEHDI